MVTTYMQVMLPQLTCIPCTCQILSSFWASFQTTCSWDIHYIDWDKLISMQQRLRWQYQVQQVQFLFLIIQLLREKIIKHRLGTAEQQKTSRKSLTAGERDSLLDELEKSKDSVSKTKTSIVRIKIAQNLPISGKYCTCMCCIYMYIVKSASRHRICVISYCRVMYTKSQADFSAKVNCHRKLSCKVLTVEYGTNRCNLMFLQPLHS